MTSKRSFGLVLAACVVGAAVALLAGSRVWETTSKVRPAPLPPTPVTHSGNSLVPWLLALALVALAGAGALLATRGTARRVVGVLIAVAGLGVVAGAARGFAFAWGWPLLALLGGLAIIGSGVLAVWSGAAWPSMGARYERGAADRSEQRRETPVSMWDDLDRGVDPTQGPNQMQRPGE